jgi:hypothetical protein
MLSEVVNPDILPNNGFDTVGSQRRPSPIFGMNPLPTRRHLFDAIDRFIVLQRQKRPFWIWLSSNDYSLQTEDSER